MDAKDHTEDTVTVKGPAEAPAGQALPLEGNNKSDVQIP
jgi:hypothetical protein